MFRIAFLIGLILTTFSLSVTASPLLQTAEKDKESDEKYLKFAKRMITQHDKNDDQKLSTDEWKSLLLSPAKADVNEDQQITVAEYARWAQSYDRSKKTKQNRPDQTKPKANTQKPKADGPKPAKPKKLQQLEKPQSTNKDEQQSVRENREQPTKKNTQQRKNANLKSEQQLVEQIERELDQRDQRERTESSQRAMQQRERDEAEQNQRRELERRERDEMEQNRRREIEQHERDEIEQRTDGAR